MNQGAGANSWLVVGGVISLLMHLIGGLAFVSTPPSDARPGTSPDAAMQEASEAPPEIVPGIEDSSSVSINWLGFSEPTAHTGELSETEQPALATAPMGEEAEPGQTSTRQPLATASPRAPIGPLQPEADRRALTPTAPEAREAIEPRPSLAIEPLEAEVTLVPGEEGARVSPWGAPPFPERTPGPSAGGTPTPSPQPDEGEQAEAEGGAPAGGTDLAGQPSDRESVATALREATNLTEWGKPLARKGLEIKTVHPRWSVTTRLTRLPRNPVIMVSFGPDGRVAHAEFVRFKGRVFNSGSRDVDEPLLDSVYKWRASGKPLEALGPKDRITFAIRVVLRR
ncbi:MAG: hypothetical protein ACIARR_08280 [Phycisphaerales bacterium JB059]